MIPAAQPRQPPLGTTRRAAAHLALARVVLMASAGILLAGCNGGERRGGKRECVLPGIFPGSVCGTAEEYRKLSGGVRGCTLHVDWCRNEDFRGPLPPAPNSGEVGQCCYEFTTVEPDDGWLE